MNVTAHQEKENNEETKKSKRREGEKKKRKQAADLEGAVCCPSAVVQGGAQRKKKGEFRGKPGPSRRPTAILTQPKRGRGPHHHVEEAVDWCRLRCVAAYDIKCLSPSNNIEHSF